MPRGKLPARGWWWRYRCEVKKNRLLTSHPFFARFYTNTPLPITILVLSEQPSQACRCIKRTKYYMPLRAVIIDDEPKAVQLLSLRLSQHCPEVEVAAGCTSGAQGIAAITRVQPDLVFLDIEMPNLNGFQILEAVEGFSFALIFVTAYDRFAVRAFRYCAVDYLLKPVDTKELVDAVAKARKSRIANPLQLQHLKQHYLAPPQQLPERIALPYQNGVAFVEIKEILYCESDDNYTRFYLEKGTQHLVLKPLREIQELLEDRNFIRIHRQYLVNINRIKKLVRGEGNYVVMDDERNIPVARSQKERLMEKFDWM